MMRKVVLPLAAAVAAIAVATPAAAQYYPQPRPGNGYGQGYGQHYNHFRSLQVRLNRVQHEIDRLAQYRMISRNEFRNLRNDSREIERRLRHDARDGRYLNPREAYGIERRIARLEQKIARDVRDGRRWAWRW